VAKAMRHQAASPPHTDGSIVFVTCRQWATHLIHASLGPPESTSETDIAIGSAIFAEFTLATDRHYRQTMLLRDCGPLFRRSATSRVH